MFCVLCSLLFIFHMAGSCVVVEKTALMQIRSSLVEANSEVPGSWGQSEDCCSWERVTCNNNTRVSGLNLANIYFPQSNIATEGECWNLNLTIFSSFPELQLLDLYWNSICPQNFEGLQGLTKLRYLNISQNSLRGNDNNIFESLGKLTSLEVINIYSSSLNGALQNNAFKTLKNLRQLGLGSNQLNGNIPASLFELPQLEYLDLSENFFQGHIPITLYSNLPSSLQTLKLSQNNLNGTFDFFWLRNCTMLKSVDLSRNSDLSVDVKFHGQVPPFQLRALMLSGCNLDNSIITGPNFLDTQHRLQILDLSNNNLAGSLPNWIFKNEASLLYLDVANNSLVGSINRMWQYKSNIGMLNISTNQFTGDLPTNISLVFPNLKVVDASYNIIYGYLQPALCNITNLAFMDLSNNELTGQVPPCLFTDCSELKILKLSNNNLGGPILSGVSNLSFLSAIYLDSNNFDGTLPNNLSGNNLNFMDMHGNKMSGKLDTSFWNLTLLQALSVASNSLTGEICPKICKLTGLRFLDISDNSFVGSLPNCTSKLELNVLNMSSNALVGLPTDFFNSYFVTVLDLRCNQFMGSLDWIQHLYQIRLLMLGGNLFEGQISSDLCHLQYLNIIEMSYNRLSGSLPPCIGGISFGYRVDDLDDVWSSIYDINIGIGFPDIDDMSFTYNGHYDLQGFTFSTKGKLYTYGRSFFNLMFGIDLSANMLSGEIPWEIGNLSHVKSLNLSNNSFTGPIPSAMANMSAIESLDLSYNELSGQIPWQLTQLWSLGVFSVAYNNLTGCIPNSGQFGSFSEESYLGNTNLHNSSQGNRCFPIPSPVEEEHVGEESDDPILYIISATSFVSSFWVTVAFLFCHPFGQRVVLQL